MIFLFEKCFLSTLKAVSSCWKTLHIWSQRTVEHFLNWTCVEICLTYCSLMFINVQIIIIPHLLSVDFPTLPLTHWGWGDFPQKTLKQWWWSRPARPLNDSYQLHPDDLWIHCIFTYGAFPARPWRYPFIAGWFLWTGKSHRSLNRWWWLGGTQSWRNGNPHMFTIYVHHTISCLIG